MYNPEFEQPSTAFAVVPQQPVIKSSEQNSTAFAVVPQQPQGTERMLPDEHEEYLKDNNDTANKSFQVVPTQ